MKNLPLILLGVFTAGVSHAATVTWSAATNTGLIDSSAGALGVGNYVRIGYFGTLSNSQIQTDATTLTGISLLNADFHEFANTTVGTNTSNTPSTFSLNSSPGYPTLTSPSAFAPGSQIYFWALDSTNNTSLATALNSVTQTAIAYVPFSNNSAWQFPASDVAPGVTIDVSQLSNVNSVFMAGSYVSGNSASLNSIFGTPNHALQLANVSAVPEPSTFAVGVLAALAALGPRKRNRR